MKKVSDFIFEYLAETVGVKHAFILPGGGCMHLIDSLGRNKQIDYTCTLHEQAAAIAAEAYGQYTNHLGLTLVTAGPGSTNAITGVAGAWIDSTPMLILSGQAKTTDLIGDKNIRQMGIQEVTIAEIVKPVTKYAKCVTDPAMIKYELQKAVYLATHGRKGPVWLDIPLDVQGAMVDIDSLVAFDPPSQATDKVELEKIRALVTLLEKSKRPAILVGNGVRAADAIQLFRKVIDKLQIPVMTSWKAADFIPEDHPLYVGRPGIIAQRGSNFVQQKADCLILLGTRLDLCQTGFNHPGFAPKAQKVIIDVDINEINKLEMDFTIKIAADAEKFLSALDTELTSFKPAYSSWLATCREWWMKYPVIPPEYCIENESRVNTYFLIQVLYEQLSATALIIPGSSGACAEVTMQAIKIRDGQRVQNTPGLGAMGFGLPACIGACIASGGKETVGIVGDGGVQMNIQELQTLKRLGVPVKLFILNNAGYGSIYGMQKNRFNGNYVACDADSGMSLPDLEKLSGAYGLRYIRIDNQAELRDKVEAVLGMPGPVICDVIVDPDIPSAPRLSSEVRADGTIVSKPMEDLAPFLDRDEFNMIMELE